MVIVAYLPSRAHVPNLGEMHRSSASRSPRVRRRWRIIRHTAAELSHRTSDRSASKLCNVDSLDLACDVQSTRTRNLAVRHPQSMLRSRQHSFSPTWAIVLGLGVVLLLRTSDALACPDCSTARLVRVAVFDGKFWINLVSISAPLVVLVVITVLLHRIGVERRPPTSASAKEAKT